MPPACGEVSCELLWCNTRHTTHGGGCTTHLWVLELDAFDRRDRHIFRWLEHKRGGCYRAQHATGMATRARGTLGVATGTHHSVQRGQRWRACLGVAATSHTWDGAFARHHRVRTVAPRRFDMGGCLCSAGVKGQEEKRNTGGQQQEVHQQHTTTHNKVSPVSKAIAMHNSSDTTTHGSHTTCPPHAHTQMQHTHLSTMSWRALHCASHHCGVRLKHKR